MGRRVRISRSQRIVLRFCNEGMAPSQIDRDMGLVEGTAYVVILRWWNGEITLPKGTRRDLSGVDFDLELI